VRVLKYITPEASRGIGVPGQPVPQYYFDRPLGVLFGECFKVGFVLDGLEELVWPEGSTGSRPLSWANFSEIPQVLVARMRVAGPPAAQA
jgi:hypothetical protein